MADEVLRVENLHAWYGESHVLHGVDFSVRKGEVVTLLGRNGAGRTSTLKSILGLTGRRTGSIVVNGVAAWQGLQGVTSFNIAQALVDDLLGRRCAAVARRLQA